VEVFAKMPVFGGPGGKAIVINDKAQVRYRIGDKMCDSKSS